MRVVPENLQNSLDSGATTLARCWQITRTDGVRLGFTDHDLPLTFDGLQFEPESGFSASSAETTTGLAAGTHDVSGVLKSDKISETDIARGLFDGAEVIVYLVDWMNPSSRLLLSRGLFGRIRRNGLNFEAEVTGISDLLNRPFGRAYVHSCECRLGDLKCGVDVSDSAYRGVASIAAIRETNFFEVLGLSDFASSWFSGGSLGWTSGANTGSNSEVKIHQSLAGKVTLETWLPPALPVEVGDTLVATAGCNKTVSECRGKFANLLNFRGFPHMPGDDVATSYPAQGGNHNGGSLLR